MSLNPPSQRAEADAAGVGEIGDDQIKKRAHELARIAGRDYPQDGDFLQAQEELGQTGELPPAPEVATAESGIAELVSWDDPPEAAGHQTEKLLPENDANLGEVLVREGLEEADHDLRIAAIDEQDFKDDTEEIPEE